MHRYSVDIFFHIQEYWVLTESRIPLKPVLQVGGMGIVALSLVLMSRLNKTEPAVFLYCRLSLLLNEPFSRCFLGESSQVRRLCSHTRRRYRPKFISLVSLDKSVWAFNGGLCARLAPVLKKCFINVPYHIL